MACEVIPDLIFRVKKGTFLDPREIDGNFSKIKDSFAEICAIIDVLDGATGGGLTGLDARVTQNESDIAINALDVAQNALDVAQNASDIAATVGLTTTNTTNINTNTLAIAANVTDIIAINVAIGSFATDIATNATDIATNATDIATNVTDIATNATVIGNLSTQQSTNTLNIGQNVTDIAQNALDIATNATDIATNLAATVANAAEINLIGKLVRITPVLLVAQSGTGTNALFPSADTVNLNGVAAVPLLAPSVILEIRTEIASDGAAGNEGYTIINGSKKLARCLTGIGVENIASNDRETEVDTKGGTVPDFDITYIQEILQSPAHAQVATSKTEVWVIGYRLP